MKFIDMERQLNQNFSPSDRPSPLSDWYVSVREISIVELSVGDICHALRQKVFVAEVLPVAISMLSEDVLAGDRYDGELICALIDAFKNDWGARSDFGEKVINVLADIDCLMKDSELLAEVRKFRALLRDQGDAKPRA
ncbi:contact-dependent growth inhibition system immunity protein [Pseudomonas maumuensis]|uniref:Uncharacterized protein n=1 Tax=Pseudomonas maumuensis TaxID=2842354 RepID=A0ABX8NS98_9PSED|nr:contact-dependent growth inhibition system immunity protein [Pseudomonas maumuensis]QXH58836.1 hypothetical protein KSS90_11705 [Pseudomonas maumuensis]